MRKLLLITLMTTVLLLCGSCIDSSEDYAIYRDMMRQLETQETQETQAPPEPDRVQRTGHLTVSGAFYTDMMLEYFNKNANAYMEMHPGVVITLDNHPSHAGYNERFPVLLMSGQIGDVVMLPSQIKPQTLNEAYFADIYPLMQSDPDFNPDDYFMNVITAYETKGKLFNLCAGFYPAGHYMVRNDISDALTDAFESDAPLSYNDIVELYLTEAASSGQEGSWSFTRDFTPMELLCYNFDTLVDFESKGAYFTDSAFMALLERVKNTIPVDKRNVQYTSGGLLQSISFNTTWGFGDLKERMNTFVFKDISSCETQSLYPCADRIFTMPRMIATAGGNYLFTTIENFAISKNCSDVDLAWDFIKFMIEEKAAPEVHGGNAHDYQMATFEHMVYTGFGYPVNRKNFETRLNLQLENSFLDAPDYQGVNISEAASAKKSYMEVAMTYMVEAAERCNLPKARYNDLYVTRETGMIWADMYLYLTNKQSVEQTMANIQNKVELWLNE